mmetsp:Transcript_10561/g.29849  ORF Transcript_10561/g.29849 Transcript_10561/m.29849 type:complete len:241 (-) Transcript_10561:1436-2158(-)
MSPCGASQVFLQVLVDPPEQEEGARAGLEVEPGEAAQERREILVLRVVKLLAEVRHDLVDVGLVHPGFHDGEGVYGRQKLRGSRLEPVFVGQLVVQTLLQRNLVRAESHVRGDAQHLRNRTRPPRQLHLVREHAEDLLDHLVRQLPVQLPHGLQRGQKRRVPDLGHSKAPHKLLDAVVGVRKGKVGDGHEHRGHVIPRLACSPSPPLSHGGQELLHQVLHRHFVPQIKRVDRAHDPAQGL